MPGFEIVELLKEESSFRIDYIKKQKSEKLSGGAINAGIDNSQVKDALVKAVNNKEEGCNFLDADMKFD